MQFNLAKHFILKVNHTNGNVALTYQQIESLVDSSVEPVITLSGGDVLCLDLDFGTRTKIDEMRYYFNSASASGTVASGIRFQYINEYYESFMDSPTLWGNDYYYTTVSGASSPTKIRFTHTLDPSISGSVHYFAVFNDDTLIDYGPNGNQEELRAIASKGVYQIYYVPVYNSTTMTATAYVRLEPSFTNIDETIYVSNSEDGPWIGIDYGGKEIAGTDTWDLGTRGTGVVVRNNKLTFQHDTEDPLVGEAMAFNLTAGLYTTKIFATTEDDLYSKLVIYNESKPYDSRVKVDPEDSSETINLKDSTSVLNYNIYRKLYSRYYSQSYYIGYKEYHVDTGELIDQDDNLFGFSSSHGNMQHYLYKVDKNSGKSFGVVAVSHGAYVFSLDHNSGSATSRSIVMTSAYSDYINLKKLEIDSSGGGWIHFYARYGVSGNDADKAGDYLLYYPSVSAAPTLKLFHSTQVIAGFSVEDNANYVWYTDPPNRMLIRGDGSGNIFLSVQIEDFRILGPCAAHPNGGCWFVNDHRDGYLSLYRVDENGLFVNRLDNFVEGDAITILSMDEGAEALWLLQGANVSYILIEDTPGLARKMFTVSVIAANDFTVVSGGCWVNSGDGKCYFVDKYLGRITKTLNSGSKEHIYSPYFVDSLPDEGTVWDSKYPLLIDQGWQSLSYKKTNNDSLYLTQNTYYQAELTLRPNSPSDLYENPSLNENWTPNDIFDGSLNNRPAEHRWNYYDDKVVIANNDLVFTGHNHPGMSEPIKVDSYRKWYFKKSSGSNFDEFEVHYTVPQVTISGSVYIRFYMYPNNTTNDSDDQYYRANLTRTVSDITLQVQARGARAQYGPTDRAYFQETATFPSSAIDGSGIIAFSRFDNGRQIRMRHYNGTIWEEVTCHTYNTAHSWYYNQYINFAGVKSLDAGIRVDSARDVTVTKFKVNEALSYFYWYYTPPIVKNIYCQPFVEIKDIETYNHKNAYIKVDVPDDGMFKVDSSYNTNLLTWWRTKL